MRGWGWAPWWLPVARGLILGAKGAPPPPTGRRRRGRGCHLPRRRLVGAPGAPELGRGHLAGD
eukprot:13876333-Alexandrium_andersonii.AAC.1